MTGQVACTFFPALIYLSSTRILTETGLSRRSVHGYSTVSTHNVGGTVQV